MHGRLIINIDSSSISIIYIYIYIQPYRYFFTARPSIYSSKQRTENCVKFLFSLSLYSSLFFVLFSLNNVTLRLLPEQNKFMGILRLIESRIRQLEKGGIKSIDISWLSSRFLFFHSSFFYI